MHHSKAGTVPQAEQVRQVPAAHYYDETHWRQELDRVFARMPLMLALTCEMPEPGDYRACEAGGVTEAAPLAEGWGLFAIRTFFLPSQISSSVIPLSSTSLINSLSSSLRMVLSLDSGPSNPGDILACSGVDTKFITNINKKRHLDTQSGFHRRWL